MDQETFKRAEYINAEIKELEKLKKGLTESFRIDFLSSDGGHRYATIEIEKVLIKLDQWSKFEKIPEFHAMVYDLTMKYKSNLIRIIENKINELKSELITL